MAPPHSRHAFTPFHRFCDNAAKDIFFSLHGRRSDPMNKLVTAPKIMRAHRARGAFLNSLVIAACLCATLMAGAATFMV